MRKIRRITEAEVISEFLKAEFYHREFDADRYKYENFVFEPDLMDETENAIRRALLFRRRATMWREVPEDTQWWEIELDPEDLERDKEFHRAQARRISEGNYQILPAAHKIRQKL